MQFKFFSIVAVFVAYVLADVKFVTPTPGTTTPSNAQISISWTEGGGTNPLSTLKGYTLTLMVGGNTEALATPLYSITGDHSTGQKSQIMPVSSPALGPPGTNAYFLKIQSTGATGTIVINYSERFTLPSMTGAWATPSIQAAYNSVKGDVTAVPPTQVQGAGNPAAPAGPPAPLSGPQFEVPYSLQTTSSIMFAPMMNYPGSAITKQNTAPLYATSAWEMAMTYLPPAFQVQTLTAAQTHSFTTRENPAAPASTAQNDMEKWLNRWKD